MLGDPNEGPLFHSGFCMRPFGVLGPLKVSCYKTT